MRETFSNAGSSNVIDLIIEKAEREFKDSKVCK